MKVTFKTADNQPVEAITDRMEIEIEGKTFILSATAHNHNGMPDDCLNVNKSDGDDGKIFITPRYANVVELS